MRDHYRSGEWERNAGTPNGGKLWVKNPPEGETRNLPESAKRGSRTDTSSAKLGDLNQEGRVTVGSKSTERESRSRDDMVRESRAEKG